MSELQAVVFWLAPNLETDARQRSALHKSWPRQGGLLSGAFVKITSGQMVLLEGSAQHLDRLLAMLDSRHGSGFWLAGTRHVTMRPKLPLLVNPSRLLASELSWIDAGMESGTLDAAELEALLRWAASRHVEMALTSQNENGWWAAPEFPFLHRRRSDRASIADFM